MSISPAVQCKKTAGMEMGLESEERARSLWPHMNGGQLPTPPPPAAASHGTAHHNLPPIAAITSCRPSTSLALKAAPSITTLDRMPGHAFTPPLALHTPAGSPSPKLLINNSPCPSPSSTSPSPRDRRNEHIFALPNPPRPLQSTTRAPTPFPDAHSQSPHAFHMLSSAGPELSNSHKPVNPLSSTSPVPFNVPSQSAFASVPRPQPLRLATPLISDNLNVLESQQVAQPSACSSLPDNAAPDPPFTESRIPPPGGTTPPIVPSLKSDISHDAKNQDNTNNTIKQISPLVTVNNGSANISQSTPVAIPSRESPHGAITSPLPAIFDNPQATLPKETSNSRPEVQYSAIKAPYINSSSEPKPVSPIHNSDRNVPTDESKTMSLSKSPMLAPDFHQDPTGALRLDIDYSDKAHQHLTSDGRKSYSNQNRRYLATPTVLTENPLMQSHAALLQYTKGQYDVARSPGTSAASIPIATKSNEPKIITQPQRAYPQNQILRSDIPSGPRYPDNFYSQSDISRGPPRSSSSTAPSQHAPGAELSVNVHRPHNAPNSPYMRPSPTSASPNSANRQYPDHNRHFLNPHEAKQFAHNPQSQDQFRPSNVHANVRGETAHYPTHYRSANLSNTPASMNPREPPMPERIPTSQATHQPADMRYYPTSNHERVPLPNQAYLSPRDVIHSAHSERPLAFNVTSTRANEIPRNMPTQAETISSAASKIRSPNPSNEYSQDRGYPQSHIQKSFEGRPSNNRINVPRVECNPPPVRHPDAAYNERGRGLPPPQQDKSYPAHSAFGLNDFARSFQQHGDKDSYNYHPNTMHKNYPPSSVSSQQQPGVNVSKYQVMPHQTYPTYTSASGLSMIPVASKKAENIQSAQQQPSESYLAGRGPVSHNVSMPPQMRPYHTGNRNTLVSQYSRPADAPKSVWDSPTSSNNRSNEAFGGKSVNRPSEAIKQVQLPQDLAQLHRTQINHQQVSQAPQSPRDRHPRHSAVNIPPGAAPPAAVSVSSSMSPRVSTQPYQNSPHSYPPRPSYPNQSPQYPQNDAMRASPHYYPPNRSLPSAVSSTSSPNLPRVNFAPGQAAFTTAHTDSHNAFIAPSSTHNPALSTPHQRLPGFHETAKNQPTMQPPTIPPQGRLHQYSTNQAYPYQQHNAAHAPPTLGTSPRHVPAKDPAARPTSSPYAPSRGHAMENDTCRNPFELPAPSSLRAAPTSSGPATVIKSHYSTPPSEQKPAAYSQRPQFDGYRVEMTKPNNDVPCMPGSSRYPMPSPRTQQRSVSGSDERQKAPQMSARFPPVPQSNFDLQRQIYDRMTGLQQAPPRLLEKARGVAKQQPGPPPQGVKTDGPPPPPRNKRESPLDLSVKTVRQSADSTKDDVDLYSAKYHSMEPRLASAPKIDFNPNFAGPLVQPEAQPLPPVQSIRKFSSPNQAVVGHMQETSPYMRKRPAEDHGHILPPKIPKIDAWKLAMDEKIEERLKAARPPRYPAAALTPLHPPAQSVTPTNPEVLQPPARPHQDLYALSHREIMTDPAKPGRGWSAGVFQPPTRPPDHDRIVQQISQGVMPPDSRYLQDHTVVDKIRMSLEEKEARLQALQAAARRGRQPLPSFDALGAERMRTPPSYMHPPPRGADPVPIGIEANRKFTQLNATPPRSQDPDLDGLAAFLAARIRTKAEMKQMGPTEAFRFPDSQGMRQNIPGSSPPKSVREGRLSQGSQGSRRLLVSPCSEDSVSSARPRDPSGVRSSSETSVFDFRESDSEGDVPGVEKPSLEGMRRPRKTHLRVKKRIPADPNEIDPASDPTPKKHEELLKPDPAWDEACDMFVEQLRTRPIKRSVRKKKPNPKFFTNELDTPTFLKIKTEAEEPTNDKIVDSVFLPKSVTVKVETDRLGENAPMPPLPAVKDESSSDDDLPGVTVVKQGRVKMITRKQRQQASDSDWGSSSSYSGSDSSSQSESDDDSEDSTSHKGMRRGRVHDVSDSEGEKRNKKRKIRTRNKGASDSNESDNSAVHKKMRTRNAAVSDSDDSEEKLSSRRTRSRPLSDSDDDVRPKNKRKSRAVTESDGENDSGDKGGRIQTRQQARSVPPARMKLRSKKRGSGKVSRTGLEDDLIRFKKKLRIPEKLISSGKSKKGKDTITVDEDSLEKLNIKYDKKVKTEKKKGKQRLESESDESSSPKTNKGGKGVVTRGKSDMMQKRSLRGSVGMRRSNKAVQNSKRHLNKSKKRSKIRRKFRSGLDYVRKPKKKPPQKKEGRETPTISEHKRRDRAEITDISSEVKSWVVDKSAGETLLHRAARLGYNEVVAYCLESLRMAPSPKDNAGYTPLHEACIKGYVAVAENLLQYGASVSESAPGGVRPLHLAVENNHVDLVRLLLSYGADPMLTTYTGQTGLTLASSDQVRDLIQRHTTDIIGDEPPKWHFDGTNHVFDSKWTSDVLSDPPSPSPSLFELEVEASRAMLPPLYRFVAAEGELFDPQERWVLLSDVVTYMKVTSGEIVTEKLPNTLRRDMADKVFVERVAACNVLSSVKPTGGKVTLLRYDDAVRQLLDVEVTTVTHKY